MILRKQLQLSGSSSLLTTPTTASLPVRGQSQLRCLHRRALRPVPSPTPFVPDTSTFLKLIGRNMITHQSKIPTWDALFNLNSEQLRDSGLEPARARRYLLRWREKFRQGEFGIGGDLENVTDGVAELRIVEIEGGEGRRRKGGGNKDSQTEHVDVKLEQGSEEEVRARERTRPAELDRSGGTRHGGVAQERRSARVFAEPSQDGATSSGLDLLGVGRKKRVVINVPVDADEAVVKTMAAALRPGTVHQLLGIRIKNWNVIAGQNVKALRGEGRAQLQVSDGLWEHKRGQKVDGGERRKAMVRAKRRAAERKT